MVVLDLRAAGDSLAILTRRIARMTLARIFAALALSGAAAATPASASTPAYIAAAVASPLRPAGDHARDAAQRAADVLAFAGVKPGDRVADFWPAPPYSTRLLSLVVGERGHVYGIVPAKQAREMPGMTPELTTDLAAFRNVTLLVQPFDAFASPEALDVVWMGKIYHDLPNVPEMGVVDTAAMNRAIFKALKPGGTYIVIDHSGGAGSGFLDTSADNARRRHRIDPQVVKAQALAAGFTLVAESRLLANAADDHTQSVFAPAMRDRSDRFVFKFRKPSKPLL
jgi:predicted methyltransferase